MAARETAVVVCPGRGTYNRDELGYLARHHRARGEFVAMVDDYRRAQGQEPVSALDARERHGPAEHGRGDNASPLIFACAYADFLAIDRDRYDVVAVTGNSMGWYIALACAGALAPADALHVVNTMGRLMHESLVGGQLVYPLVDEDWRPVPGRRAEVEQAMRDAAAESGQSLHVSIELGGMLVLAGEEAALDALARRLPPEQGRFPLRLAQHAGFHTPLQRPVAEEARRRLPADPFRAPAIPLVDGRGEVWRPYSTRPHELWGYTLDTQVVETYDFGAAVGNAVREFAPDRVIVLGPGATLGGATAQALLAIGWRGMTSKADFLDRQREDPFVLSMGMDAQRPAVTAAATEAAGAPA